MVGLAGTRVLSREQIRGWRSLPSSPPVLLLEPRDPELGNVKITQTFPSDPQFSEWVYTLPCLDREEVRASKAEARNDPRLGANPGERIRALEEGRRSAKLLAIVTAVVMLWGLIPIAYPFAVFALALLPWMALGIVKRSHGVFRIDARPKDPHPNVALPFLFPGMILLLRVMNDYDVIASLRMVWFTAGIGGLLCFLALAIDRSLRGKTGTTLAILAFSLIYGFSLGIEVNAVFDRSPGSSTQFG